MRIIRDQAIVDDDWQKVTDDAPLPAAGGVIVSWARWQAERSVLRARGNVGVAIPSSLDVDALNEDLPTLGLVELAFVFIQPKPEGGRTYDGRAYSQARLLRERHRYQGEIRAAGDIFRDAMHYMRRCGVNAFVLPPGADLEDALNAFRDFSDAYQGAADGVRPIHLRRA